MNSLVLLIILYYTYKNKEKIIELSSEKTKIMIKEKKIKTILDVRSQKEFKKGHYPNAINIPIEPINKINEKNISNLKEPILIYCRSGRRAKNAAKIIKNLGKNELYIINRTYKSLL
jgi:phage shock protein E